MPAKPYLSALGALILTATAHAQVQFLEAGERNLFPFSRTEPAAIACGDVDGDGDPDIVLAGRPAPALWVSIDNAYDYPAPGAWPNLPDSATDVVLADVDGDGDLDAVIATTAASGTAEDRLLINDGKGKFTDRSTRLPANRANNSTSVAVGDVDGDSRLDLVFGGATGLRIYRNTATGFVAGAAPTPAVNAIFQLSLVDLDGDRDLDLLATSLTAGEVAFRNDGTGAMTAIAGGFPPIPNGGRFSIADLDGDGDADMALGRLTADPQKPVADRILLNDGSGKFTDATATWLPTAVADAGNTIANALIDVTGDNKPDLLSLYAERRSLLYTNTGSGFVAANPEFPAFYTPNNLCPLDFDRDGDQDFLITSFADGIARPGLAINSTNGFYLARRAQRIESGGNTVAIADFDQSGSPDVILGRSATGQAGPGVVVGYPNDGFGTYPDDPAFTIDLPENPQTIVAEDLNGDGRIDLFVGTGTGHNRLLLQNANGTFTDATTGRLPKTLQAAADAVALDVDGDNDLDLLLANPQSGGSLLRNDGTATFADASTALPIGAGAWRGIATADVDQDGDQDVIVAGTGIKAMFLNNGSGSFTDASSRLGGSNAKFGGIAVGDVDGDGDLDLLIAGAGPPAPTQTMLFNDGSGNFTPNANFAQAITEASDAILADLDGDGDLDALLCNREFAAEYQRNDGTGKFARASTAIPSQSTGVRLAAADLDYDRDLDIVIAARPLHVLHNTHIHVRGLGLQRIGDYFRLDIFARPGYAPGPQSGILILSTARANPPLKLPQGRVGVNLATAAVIPGLVLPAQNDRHYFSFPIPADPSLTERFLYVQAVAATSFADVLFSNVATERLEN